MNKDLSVRAKYILKSIFIILSMFMLMIISLYIPIIGILFIPILIVLLCLRHSNKIAIPLMSISILIPSIIFGSILSLILGITYVIIGIILTICINKNIKFINSFCILSLVVFISNIVNLVVTIYIVNKSNFWGFAQSIVKNFNEVMKAYSDIGIDVSTNQYTQSISKIMTPQNILSAVPVIIIIFSIITAFLIYFVAEKVLIKNGYKINRITNFDKWYLEPKIGAILIIITCLSMILYSKNIVIAEYIYKTTYALFQLLMMVIGLSVINYFFQNKIKINKNFSIGIIILVLISPLNILLPILGLVDLVSDIRGIDPNSLGSALRKKLSL